LESFVVIFPVNLRFIGFSANFGFSGGTGNKASRFRIVLDDFIVDELVDAGVENCRMVSKKVRMSMKQHH
jgi:hypothetical protein